MIALDLAATERKRGGRDPFDVQVLEREAGPDDVPDRVDGADLVEVHVLDGKSVHAPLGARESGKHASAPFEGPLRKGGSIEERSDLPVSALLRASFGSTEPDVPCGDRSPAHALDPHPRLDSELSQTLPNHTGGNAQIEEGAEDHVSRRAREAVEIEGARTHLRSRG